MLSIAFDILVLTIYDEEDRASILSQIDAIQNLAGLKNMNLKIINVQGQIHLQIFGELSDVESTSISFELLFLNPLENGIRCKIVKPQGQETQLNPYYDSNLGFIDFSTYIERTDKLIDIFSKMKIQFKKEHPYEGVGKAQEQEKNSFAKNIKDNWSELNSINEFLVFELINEYKKKACLKQMIIDGQEMVDQLIKEKDKLNQFRNQNIDKVVDEYNILQHISTTPYQDQLIELDAKIKGIRDTLRLIQHNFQNNHLNFLELNQFTRNLAKEEFDAFLLLKKCLNQQLE
ncbi:unnamed protein product (macronuclear) [Paramecium tetraurelia]|uniref:SB domain-containing protein n=1 Tax=Paramecium tetraurelia TaxID=5888 RepID=A0BPW4_PARTE|nr:uncharacterized protein GSPATT00005331001 [Paramecium tetraurelia]CAK60581.1 unnamed protein product [Paramecium tetraurelia]|eukprot:XP_001427979.1 hypothetical protein (macronuclear) [Paramecium tetraurelia strain d4-2]